MDKKKILIVMFLAVVLVTAGVDGYLYFFTDISPSQIISTQKESNKPIEIESADRNKGENTFPVKPVKEEIKTIIINEKNTPKSEVTKTDLSRIASSFAERFGSYSNQSNYTNINDLRIFMSRRMQNWSERYVVEAKEKNPDSAIYYGVTTKAIQQDIVEYDSDVGNARILVKTQRREATGTMSNSSSYYQDIMITFIKENNIWKVDSANWQST